jgi:hypothetical protein
MDKMDKMDKIYKKYKINNNKYIIIYIKKLIILL